jgi:hypothetical protein
MTTMLDESGRPSAAQDVCPRMAATSIHAPGARVEHRYTNRQGVVERAWRKHYGTTRPEPYVMVDVKYDDDTTGFAWEQDLLPVTQESPLGL